MLRYVRVRKLLQIVRHCGAEIRGGIGESGGERNHREYLAALRGVAIVEEEERILNSSKVCSAKKGTKIS